MILFLFYLILPFAAADILSDHLAKNVNVSVDPCDNFFLHVCSQSVNSTEFPFSKISKFYKNIAEKYFNISRSPNLSIMHDIIKLNETTDSSKPFFDRFLFRNLVYNRCGDSYACNREEFNHFYKIYEAKSNQTNDRLTYFVSKLSRASGVEIRDIIPLLVQSIYDSLNFNYSSLGIYDKYPRQFYGALTNRLFVMEELKKDGIFERIVNIQDDLRQFKELILEKFKNTPWLNEKDILGLSMMSQFEDRIKEMIIYYDLDENDRDLELLRSINSKFTEEYYKAKQKSTGNEVLDILFALETAYNSRYHTHDSEEIILFIRVDYALVANAFYAFSLNRVAILAPFLYPELTDNATLNKHYNLFSVIGHEIFHSVVLKKWANASVAFKNGMNCLDEHYNRTCELFGEGSCNSGQQTFTEDGPDLEGLRIDYEFLMRNYKPTELKEIVFESDDLVVNREQAFFYLHGISFCGTMKKLDNHTDVHSPPQVRVNGVVMQMPEFAKAFSCSPDQQMFAVKEQTCNLFGPDSR